MKPQSTEAIAAEPAIPVIDPAPIEPTTSGSSVGSVIAILLIVALLVVGAFYVWQKRLAEERAMEAQSAVQE